MKRRKTFLEEGTVEEKDSKQVPRTPAENITKHFDAIESKTNSTKDQIKTNTYQNNNTEGERHFVSQNFDSCGKDTFNTFNSQRVTPYPCNSYDTQLSQPPQLKQQNQSFSRMIEDKSEFNVVSKTQISTTRSGIRSCNLNRSQVNGTRENEIGHRLNDIKSRLPSIRKSTQQTKCQTAKRESRISKKNIRFFF